jgi:fructose-1,6-bisphosphatase/inositol monophosphatase family enzyme
MERSLDQLGGLLADLGLAIRAGVRAGQEAAARGEGDMERVEAETAADTIYAIDRWSEEAIAHWMENHWPSTEPVELVMEGLEEVRTFPADTPPERLRWKLIIDPIDGTRCIMFDKRPAWALLGLAPHHGDETRLSHIQVSAMVELPTRKQGLADHFVAVVGGGARAWRTQLGTGESAPLAFRPSGARDFRHGFSSLVKFFPEGRALTARLEEALWQELVGLGVSPSPVIFDDQYLSTGGQFSEILAGHDRMVGDLRPRILAALGLDSSLVCHPYDACAWPLLTEAGAVFTNLDGGFPDAPLDTTSPVEWLAFANPALAELARPVLRSAWNQLEKELHRSAACP